MRGAQPLVIMIMHMVKRHFSHCFRVRVLKILFTCILQAGVSSHPQRILHLFALTYLHKFQTHSPFVKQLHYKKRIMSKFLQSYICCMFFKVAKLLHSVYTSIRLQSLSTYRHFKMLKSCIQI